MIAIIILGVITILFWMILYVRPLHERAFNLYKGSLSAEQLRKHRALAVGRSENEIIRQLFCERWRLVCLGLTIGVLLSLYLYLSRLEIIYFDSFERPDFGEGRQAQELVVHMAGKEIPYKLTLNEKEPQDDELKSFFDESADRAFKVALQNNKSADRVVEDLELKDKLANGVEISWRVSDLKAVSSFGELRRDIPEEGKEVTLKAVLSYGSYEREYELDIHVYPKEHKLSEEEQLKQYIKDNLNQAEGEIFLPLEYNDEKLEYSTAEDVNYKNILIVAVLLTVILWLVSSDKLDKAYKRRQDELLRDYPGIVSRLGVLISAGLSVPESWKRMGHEYERRKKAGEKPSAGYEELLLSVAVLENTGQTRKAIFEFGQRCQEKQYRNLASLLISSIQKGSVQVSKQLKRETEIAFEMRKENAHIAGEKAQAKLMIPTFILFALVMAMVIFPVWAGL